MDVFYHIMKNRLDRLYHTHSLQTLARVQISITARKVRTCDIDPNPMFLFVFLGDIAGEEITMSGYLARRSSSFPPMGIWPHDEHGLFSRFRGCCVFYTNPLLNHRRLS
jgi:hypothetical protein